MVPNLKVCFIIVLDLKVVIGTNVRTGKSFTGLNIFSEIVLKSFQGQKLFVPQKGPQTSIPHIYFQLNNMTIQLHFAPNSSMPLFNMIFVRRYIFISLLLLLHSTLFFLTHTLHITYVLFLLPFCHLTEVTYTTNSHIATTIAPRRSREPT